MNYTFIENPYKDENSVVTTRGVMTDAKIAKLNNVTKRPAIVKNWEDNRPQPVVSLISTPETKDYSSLLNTVGITIVNHAKEADNSGAKKLRVNKIVNEKAINIYDNSEKIDMVPEKVAVPKEEKKEEVKVENPLEPNIFSSREDVHGRHERTGEIPVDAIKEAVKNDKPPVSSDILSRSERNANIMINDQSKESKAGDMDLYNNLLHNVSVGQNEDVSRQLQGARNQLSIEQEESKKLAYQYGEAVKELAKLKEDIENTKKQQEQQVKEELSITLKNIESLQKENLERTSDLTSIQSEIAKLKAEKRAMEESFYEDNHSSYGRAA